MVKTRKQPLTVTAQFQNSLTALMDTLNQVMFHLYSIHRIPVALNVNDGIEIDVDPMTYSKTTFGFI